MPWVHDKFVGKKALTLHWVVHGEDSVASEVNLGLASWKFERSNPSAVELPGKAPWENGARRDG